MGPSGIARALAESGTPKPPARRRRTIWRIGSMDLPVEVAMGCVPASGVAPGGEKGTRLKVGRGVAFLQCSVLPDDFRCRPKALGVWNAYDRSNVAGYFRNEVEKGPDAERGPSTPGTPESGPVLFPARTAPPTLLFRCDPPNPVQGATMRHQETGPPPALP